MNKLFSLFCAVLVALSVSATPIKQSIDLSSVEEYGTVTWNAETKTIETDKEHNWAGVHTYATLDATGYSKLVLVLKDGYETVNVNLTVEYSEGTPASQSITNVAGLKTICIPLNGTNISDIIIRVINNSSSAVLDELYLYKVVGKEEEVNLFNDSHAFGNWQNWLPLCADLSKYNSLHEGDKVVINYTGKVEGSKFQVRICDTAPALQLSQAGDYVDISGASQAEFELCEEDIVALQAHGMYLNGENLTITKVSLLTYSQQIMVERVLNTGEENLTWSKHWEHTDLPTLAADDELRVTVSAVTADPKVNFRHNDEGNDPVVIEGIDETVPKVYTVSLTAAQAEDINNGKLFIVGQNATLSHFAIAQPMSIYDENLLWYGEEAAGDSWGTPVNLPAGKFSSVEVGDILNVLLTELDAEGQLFLTQGNYANFTVKPNFYLNGNCAAPMALSFVINAFMKDELQANGLLVSGKKFTVSAVYVIKAEAHTESYFLKVSDAEMATLVLPFNATLPAGVEAYRLTTDGSDAIEATAVSAIQADKPVLIIAAANTDPGYEFVSGEGADTCIFYKNTWSVGTYADGALHGNYANEFSIPNKYEIESVMNYFYVLQNGASGVGFYQLQYWGDVKVNPYRAFLGCSLNLNGFGSEPSQVSGRRMRIVFRNDAPTGLENTQTSTNDSQKVLLNGQILIKRGNNTYNMLGQQL